jgi:hypothetical protein
MATPESPPPPRCRTGAATMEDGTSRYPTSPKPNPCFDIGVRCDLSLCSLVLSIGYPCRLGMIWFSLTFWFSFTAFPRDVMFSLELKVQGFASKDSPGRKSYTKGRVLSGMLSMGR